ncbi:related to O-methyltransferase [Ramularia collo-cygni]|uniref:Related to O-methyltransferase n=1 Tax=Ramularia collo-cygni TaxID=112498 RepID=A0A2D3V871_9PEZI|nr:related to O-methyltransferase [Ramularia collo-cygni]CZT17689.1 related to O-methyltransferase [Ramularia collo-cygni]
MATSDSSTLPSHKRLVQEGYDKMAAEYTAWALTGSHTRMQYVAKALEQLPRAAQSTILEVGCGAGAPVLEHLVRKVSHVFANDISSTQLNLARERCPGKTTFLSGDMATLEIAPGTLDVVMGFYSILHLPRDEQPAMIGLIHGWLKEGGLLVMNLGTEDQEELRGKFFGQEMYWSTFSAEKSKQMIRDAGFELLEAEVKTGEDLDASDPDHGISFLWILAKKSTGP